MLVRLTVNAVFLRCILIAFRTKAWENVTNLYATFSVLALRFFSFFLFIFSLIVPCWQLRSRSFLYIHIMLFLVTEGTLSECVNVFVLFRFSSVIYCSFSTKKTLERMSFNPLLTRIPFFLFFFFFFGLFSSIYRFSFFFSFLSRLIF